MQAKSGADSSSDSFAARAQSAGDRNANTDSAVAAITSGSGSAQGAQSDPGQVRPNNCLPSRFDSVDFEIIASAPSALSSNLLSQIL